MNDIRKPLVTFLVTAFVLILSLWLRLHTTYGCKDVSSSITEQPVQQTVEPDIESQKVIMLPQVIVDPNPFIVPITDEEYEWLCKLVSAESRGESLEGQIAVANVVLNRVTSPLFPNTVMEVIFQKGQYCPVRNGSIHREPTEQSRKAVDMALRGHREVPEDILYFYAPSMVSRGNWIRTRKVVMQIGVHAFATQERSR